MSSQEVVAVSPEPDTARLVGNKLVDPDRNTKECDGMITAPVEPGSARYTAPACPIRADVRQQNLGSSPAS